MTVPLAVHHCGISSSANDTVQLLVTPPATPPLVSLNANQQVMTVNEGANKDCSKLLTVCCCAFLYSLLIIALFALSVATCMIDSC